MSPDRYFIKDGYRSRAEPEYFEDSGSAIAYQPDVYVEAGRVAERIGARRIIDLGCGSGTKLVELHPRFEVIGIDYGPNVRAARERHPFATWLEHDLGTCCALPLEAAQLEGSVLVCADVIEHLVRPETLLRKLRAALARAEGVVLSTPERDLTRGPDHFGPPPNACHVREWTIGELAALLAAEGFDHRWLGLTRSWDQTPHLHTILAFLFPDGARLCAATGGLCV